MRQIFQKVPQSTFYVLVLISLKHPILEAFLVKNHRIMDETLLATTKYKNLVNKTFNIYILKSLDD